MITWDDATSIAQDLSSDSTATTLTSLKRFENIGYKLILAELGRPVTEKTSSGLVTTASIDYVNLPMDCLYPKTVTVTYNSRPTPIYEEESQEVWDQLKTYPQESDPPQRFFVRQNFGIGHSQLLFYPTPSTSDLLVTVVYEAIDKDLSNDLFNTANITLTNADATITHSAAGFTAAMVGRYVKAPDGYFYRIASFTNTSSMELEGNYEGSTVTTGALIYEMFNLPEEMQILPVYFALAHFFGIKKDTTQETKYWTLYTQGVEAGKRRWGTKTRSALTRGSWLVSRFGSWAPPFFPNSAT